MTMIIGGSISGALFGDKQRFRYALWRIWDKQKDRLLFIGLNPSRAGELKDDPTIRRMINYAKLWGFGGLFVGNLFSIVSANPAVLFVEPPPELPGGPNDRAIKRMRELTSTVVVGWGRLGKYAGTRTAEVLKLVGSPVYSLGKTKDGEPSHPLYLRSSLLMTPYERGAK